MRIRTKTRSEKAARTRKRNANPLLAAKKLAERPQPADGIERRKSKLTGEELEFCVTPEAKAKRRITILVLAAWMCQKCGWDLIGDNWHWHHKKFRSQGGDDSLKNALALCVSCHAKEHGVGKKNYSGVRTERTGRFTL